GRHVDDLLRAWLHGRRRVGAAVEQPPSAHPGAPQDLARLRGPPGLALGVPRRAGLPAGGGARHRHPLSGGLKKPHVGQNPPLAPGIARYWKGSDPRLGGPMTRRLAALLASRSSWFDLGVFTLGLGLVFYSTFRVVSNDAELSPIALLSIPLIVVIAKF